MHRRWLLPVKTLLAFCLVAFVFTFSAHTVRADTYSDVVDGLNSSGAYVTPHPPAGSHIRPEDLQRLRNQVTNASNLGIDEDIAVVSSYPPNFRSPQEAAASLLNFLDFDGVLVLVSPQGIALSSDQLTDAEDSAIARRARPTCETQSWTSCALLAARLAVTQGRADKNSAFHDAIVFWAIFFIALAILIVIAIIALQLRRRGKKSHRGELRRSAEATLAELDDAVRTVRTVDVEHSSTAATTDLPPSSSAPLATTAEPVASQYERAMELRGRAHAALDEPASELALIQANEDAAQARLLLRRTTPSGDATADAAPPSEPGASAIPCLYCAREDRGPYVNRIVDDGRGHTLSIEICSACQAQLERGQTPRVVAATYHGDQVPWWTVPTSAWRDRYGGASWQYWLPFLFGMDVGGWFQLVSKPAESRQSGGTAAPRASQPFQRPE